MTAVGRAPLLDVSSSLGTFLFGAGGATMSLNDAALLEDWFLFGFEGVTASGGAPLLVEWFLLGAGGVTASLNGAASLKEWFLLETDRVLKGVESLRRDAESVVSRRDRRSCVPSFSSTAHSPLRLRLVSEEAIGSSGMNLAHDQSRT